MTAFKYIKHFSKSSSLVLNITLIIIKSGEESTILALTFSRHPRPNFNRLILLPGVSSVEL